MSSTGNKRILVGVDLTPGGDEPSPGAKLAIAQARDLAPRLGASVMLVHASSGDEHVNAVDGGRILRTEAGMSSQGRDALEAETKRLREADIQTELVIDDEREPWRAICHLTRVGDDDLVLISKRSIGHFDMDDRRMGAVALELLRSCPCPVWTVKHGSDTHCRRVMAASDLSDDVGRRVIQHASRVARLFEAELHVLHACTLSWAGAMLGSAERKLESRREEATNRLKALCREVSGAASAVLHTPLGEPFEALREATGELDVDLLVMGTLSRRGIAGMLIGNTAERAVTQLDRSLLTIKPRGFRRVD